MSGCSTISAIRITLELHIHGQYAHWPIRARGRSTPYLFPGGRPGRPIAPDTISRRLNALGITVRLTRNGALLAMVGHVHWKVLADLLGVSNTAAQRWHAAAGGDRTSYVASRLNQQPPLTALNDGKGSMPSLSLDVADAAELAEMLQFLSDWLATEPVLEASLNRFVGHPAYGISELRADLDRFTLLPGHRTRRQRHAGPVAEPGIQRVLPPTRSADPHTIRLSQVPHIWLPNSPDMPKASPDRRCSDALQSGQSLRAKPPEKMIRVYTLA